MTSARELTERLRGHWHGSYGKARCPKHPDKNPSLSIRDGKNGEPIVNCHAGCDWRDIKDELRSKGLLDDEKSFNSKAKSFVETYVYTDKFGKFLTKKERYAPKGQFPQYHYESGTWKPGLLGSTPRVLYRLPELIEAVAQERPIFICEGEKAVNAAVTLGVPATCSGGANSWRGEFAGHFKGATVIILPDNDEPGRKYAEQVAKSLNGVAASVTVLALPALPKGGDLFDWIQAGGTAARLWALVETDSVNWASDGLERRLQPICIHQLLKLDIPVREMILDPIIPGKGLAMLYASRGIGKTHVACGISNAVSTGMKFLKWQAPKPRKVLHVDGELPAVELRERFAQVMAGSTAKPESGMLNILTADLIEAGIGNLADPKVQAELEPWLDGVELLVLDNLSSLTSVIRDNDAESWSPIQEWLLRLRRRGVSVLIVHHAGKGGEQRGTSRREDVLDTSISLRRPSDYTATEGARFEVHFEKARGIHGICAKPFEAKLEVRDQATVWTIREIEDVNLARVKALLDDELTIRDIADETGLSKSQVGRLKKQIEGQSAAAEAASHADT